MCGGAPSSLLYPPSSPSWPRILPPLFVFFVCSGPPACLLCVCDWRWARGMLHVRAWLLSYPGVSCAKLPCLYPVFCVYNSAVIFLVCTDRRAVTLHLSSPYIEGDTKFTKSTQYRRYGYTTYSLVLNIAFVCWRIKNKINLGDGMWCGCVQSRPVPFLPAVRTDDPVHTHRFGC